MQITETTTKIINEKDTSKMDNPLSQLDKNQVFELILEHVGGFGWFQKILWLIGLISCFLGVNFVNIL